MSEIEQNEVVREWLNALMYEIPERLCELVRELRGIVVLLGESVKVTATHTARVLTDLQRVEEQIGYLEKVMYRLCDESNKAQLIGPVLRALHGDASAAGEDGEGNPPQPEPSSSSSGGGVTPRYAEGATRDDPPQQGATRDDPPQQGATRDDPPQQGGVG